MSDSIPSYTPAIAQWPSAFLGFTALQSRYAMPAWSYEAELRPPGAIIELGTYEGGFSCLLAILARNYGASFLTADWNDYNPRWIDWFKLLQIDFRRRDIFAAQFYIELASFIAFSRPPLWLLCDDGDKAKEVDTFAPLLSPGDLIAAHDYGYEKDSWVSNEIWPERIDAQRHQLTRYKSDLFNSAAWLVYQRQ